MFNFIKKKKHKPSPDGVILDDDKYVGIREKIRAAIRAAKRVSRKPPLTNKIKLLVVALSNKQKIS